MSIMAIMMTVALPVWKQNAQREKEEELIFRGKQYVHAIALFQRKYPGTYPPNLNVLAEQKFLRKKYKDPITDDDFVPIPFGQATPGGTVPGVSGGVSGGRSGQSSSTQPSTSSAQSPSTPSMASRGSTPTSTIAANTGRGGSTFNPGTTVGGTGIQGVTSKSKDESIRIYNGRTHYNEWQFLYTAPANAGRGAPQPGAVPGQPGTPGQQQPGPPGQRGRGQNPGQPFPGGQGFPPGGPNRGFGPGGQQFPQPGQTGRGRG